MKRVRILYSEKSLRNNRRVREFIGSAANFRSITDRRTGAEYVAHLEQLRIALHAGKVDARALTQETLFALYLLLLRDWRGLSLFYKALLPQDTGLAEMFRSVVEKLHLTEWRTSFEERTEPSAILLPTGRPWPPIAAMAPPCTQVPA